MTDLKENQTNYSYNQGAEKHVLFVWKMLLFCVVCVTCKSEPGNLYVYSLISMDHPLYALTFTLLLFFLKKIIKSN